MYSKADFQQLFAQACKDIKQTNRKGEFPASISKHWTIAIANGSVSFQVLYLDGNGEKQVHSVAL